jgi:hypothetical protein
VQPAAPSGSRPKGSLERHCSSRDLDTSPLAASCGSSGVLLTAVGRHDCARPGPKAPGPGASLEGAAAGLFQQLRSCAAAGGAWPAPRCPDLHSCFKLSSSHSTLDNTHTHIASCSCSLRQRAARQAAGAACTAWRRAPRPRPIPPTHLPLALLPAHHLLLAFPLCSTCTGTTAPLVTPCTQKQSCCGVCSVREKSVHNNGGGSVGSRCGAKSTGLVLPQKYG